MRLGNQSGATAVVVAVFVAALLAFGALAVDVGNLYLSRTELQNAADACALRGATVLFTEDGAAVNTTGANQEGHDAGEANESQKSAVEIDWTSGNDGDVRRGHWSFSAPSFTGSDSATVVDLWNVSTDELDANTDFINAVRCVSRREATPVTNFLAPVLGLFGGNFATSVVRAEAVAVRGFTGSLLPGEVDLPIAVCAEKLRDGDGEYSCSIGRMLNDGNTEGTSETAMWTDFGQSSTCSASSASAIRPLVCGGGNPGELAFGANIDSTNGTTTAAFDDLVDCWKTGLHLDTNGDEVPDTDLDGDNDGWPDQLWEADLPVVNCSGNDPCTPLAGAVTVNVVWVVRSANLSGTNRYDEAPARMGDWACSTPAPTTGAEREACWGEFVSHFNLRNSDDAAAPYASKSIYFVPDCSPHEPAGRTGGENFGMLARYPALVR